MNNVPNDSPKNPYGFTEEEIALCLENVNYGNYNTPIDKKRALEILTENKEYEEISQYCEIPDRAWHNMFNK